MLFIGGNHLLLFDQEDCKVNVPDTIVDCICTNSNHLAATLWIPASLNELVALDKRLLAILHVLPEYAKFAFKLV